MAAGRGHKVTVLEKNDALGGQLLIAARAPRREGFLDFVRYEEVQMQLLGVDVRLGSVAPPEMVLELEPDAVIIATVSLPRTQDNAGAERANVVQRGDVMAGTATGRTTLEVVCCEEGVEQPSVGGLSH